MVDHKEYELMTVAGAGCGTTQQDVSAQILLDLFLQCSVLWTMGQDLDEMGIL